MTLQSKLDHFQVDPEYGFLPSYTPSRRLPPAFEAWEKASEQLSAALRDQKARQLMEAIPLLSPVNLSERADQERALLLVAAFSHAWLKETQEKSIPPQLAIPFAAMAQKMGRPSIITHSSMVLNNWHKKDPHGPFTMDNLGLQRGFEQSPSESWFFLLTAMVEYEGADSLMLTLAAWDAAKQGELEQLLEKLSALPTAINAMTQTLLRMEEGCQPEVFFHQIRPYIASMEAVCFEGVEEQPIRSFSGGSAAQSSLIQALDAGLGIAHEEPDSSGYLRLMRGYMPPRHRELLSVLDDSAIPAAVQTSSQLQEAYQACVEAIRKFRTAHLRIVSIYIVGPARAAGQSTQGTGGTDALDFLNQLRKDTQ
ncbi:MAG: hypothetical protein AAF206_27155 [Bacteroidota bacterium]